MESIKKIGIFVGVAGAIAVGYYLLRKTKPTVAEQQLSQLNTDEKTSIEQDLFIPNPSTPSMGATTTPTRTPTVTPTYTPTSTTTSTRSTTSTTPRTTTSTQILSGRR